MDYKVVIMPKAIGDLEENAARIAKDDPQAAERFGNL
jgi:hypothetical protein